MPVRSIAGCSARRSPAGRWFSCISMRCELLADPALYDMQSMRAFCGLELVGDGIPDETTILNFRHLLEHHELTKAIFEAVSAYLRECGEMLRGGTIVDATLIAVSPSTNNNDRKRDPEMRSSKKGGISASSFDPRSAFS